MGLWADSVEIVGLKYLWKIIHFQIPDALSPLLANDDLHHYLVTVVPKGLHLDTHVYSNYTVYQGSSPAHLSTLKHTTTLIYEWAIKTFQQNDRQMWGSNLKICTVCVNKRNPTADGNDPDELEIEAQRARIVQYLSFWPHPIDLVI